MTVQRRQFLRGAAAAVAGTALAGAGGRELLTVNRAEAATTSPTASRSIPFYGTHQAGIATDRQAQAAFIAFDLTTSNRAGLITLLHDLTARAAFLTAGGVPPNLGISAPPSDSGLLGPTIGPGGLTVTVSVGASVFDGRYGLAGRKPRRLRKMDTFVNDNLDAARSDGDLLLQLCADEPDTVIHALRDLARHTRGAMQPRWRADGFVAPPRPTGASRNLLGFKDGIAGPKVADATEMNQLVWVQSGSGEPAWTTDGSYQVVRLIRMLTEFWDRVGITEQEKMIGRRRDSGAPLSGTAETDIPDYRDDPVGGTTPLNAHIRVANPRTAETKSSQMLRRGYNYDAGLDSNGNLDMGLIFSCYQQDLDRQFVAVQKKLADEPLVDYISPVGGGYFFAAPGVRDVNDWYFQGLFT
jgi:deferrochelatase/peroxidase EfeB